jgi:hypothetical protein
VEKPKDSERVMEGVGSGFRLGSGGVRTIRGEIAELKEGERSSCFKNNETQWEESQLPGLAETTNQNEYNGDASTYHTS